MWKELGATRVVAAREVSTDLKRNEGQCRHRNRILSTCGPCVFLTLVVVYCLTT